MARKRMFDIEIVDTDLFLEMSNGARLLYYDLGMRADDDGFVSNPKKIMKMTNASEDDLKVLMAKQFIIPFESGICVIKHWKINNYLRKDRYTETIYKQEKRLLDEDENGIYTLGIPVVDTVKKSIEENSIVNKKKGFKKPSLEEVTSYCEERKNGINPTNFIDFYESKDWFVGKNKMKDWKASVRTWENRKDEKPKSDKTVAPVPSWLNQKIEAKPLSKEDKEKWDKIMKEFKEE